MRIVVVGAGIVGAACAHVLASAGLDVTVLDGKVTTIDGSSLNPITEGYICAKVRRFPERVYGPDRLLYPAVRKGPKGAASFQRVSWEEALGEIAERLIEARDKWGGESILPYSYGGSNGLLTQDTSDAALFRRLRSRQRARNSLAVLATFLGLTQKIAANLPPPATASIAVTLIFAADRALSVLVIAPTRSLPCNRKPLFFLDSLSFSFFAARVNAAVFSGTRSIWPFRPLGKPENASRLTPCPARPARIFAP